MNNISFQGNIKLTKYVDGVKNISNYKTDSNADRQIQETASRLFGFYNPTMFKVLKSDPEAAFRNLIGKIINQDLTKKDYFESSILRYTPNEITLREMNRYQKGGIEFDIKF